MSDVVNLTQYARSRESSGTTGLASISNDSKSWYRTVETAPLEGLLSAAVLRKLDVDSPIGRFVGLAYDALERLSASRELLPSDPLGSDDHFIACKPVFAEMLMFRELSDSAGLIALKCFQASTSVKAIVDAPNLLSVLERTLTRICSAPFMEFQEACTLASEIENAAQVAKLPGLAVVANELIGDSNIVPES